MAKYRPIYTKIWKDPDFLEYPPEDKLIFIYLCTNELTTESGIYPISLKTIANEATVNLETVSQRFQNGNLKNVFYDKPNNLVFVRNFKKYNGGGKPDLVRKSILQDCKTYPSSPLWKRFIEAYPEYKDDILTIIQPLDNSSPSLTTMPTDTKPFTNGSSKIRTNPNPNPNPNIPKGAEQHSASTKILSPTEFKKANKKFKKYPPEYTELRKQVFAGLKKRRGYNSPNPMAEAVAISEMCKNYTPEQQLQVWDFIKRENKFYFDKEVTMMYVKTQIGAILKSQEQPAISSVRYANE